MGIKIAGRRAPETQAFEVQMMPTSIRRSMLPSRGTQPSSRAQASKIAFSPIFAPSRRRPRPVSGGAGDWREDFPGQLRLCLSWLQPSHGDHRGQRRPSRIDRRWKRLRRSIRNIRCWCITMRQRFIRIGEMRWHRNRVTQPLSRPFLSSMFFLRRSR